MGGRHRRPVCMRAREERWTTCTGYRRALHPSPRGVGDGNVLGPQPRPSRMQMHMQVGGVAEGGREGPCVRGGCCGLVLRPVGEAWEPHAEPSGGDVGQGIAASRSQGHAARLPHDCARTGAVVVPSTTAGDPRSLTAGWHRWRCREGWIPHSHGRGALGALKGVPGCAERFPALRPTQDGFWVAALQPL